MAINTLRLLIIADDPLAGAGLAALLANRPECNPVAQLSSQINLLTELDSYQPDVLLWDLGWQPEAVLADLINFQDIRVPAVVLLPDASHMSDVWLHKPHGVLFRDVDDDKLVAALLAAQQGLVTLDPELSSAISSNLPTSLPQLSEALTPRELEVLQHLAEGLPNKSIARQLGISEHTIKFHVNAIMSKLGAQSRTEAVVRATQLGLILL